MFGLPETEAKKVITATAMGIPVVFIPSLLVASPNMELFHGTAKCVRQPWHVLSQEELIWTTKL